MSLDQQTQDNSLKPAARKKRPPPPPVPAMRLKMDPPPEPKPPPTEKAIVTHIGSRELRQAARAINTLRAACASDITQAMATAFVHAAAPALQEIVGDLRGSDRRAIKTALNACVARLGALLKGDAKEDLRRFLIARNMHGTISAHLDGHPTA